MRSSLVRAFQILRGSSLHEAKLELEKGRTHLGVDTMGIYTEAEKRSTSSVDVEALLRCSVLVDGCEAAPLRSALKGEATIIHFVRNGA